MPKGRYKSKKAPKSAKYKKMKNGSKNGGKKSKTNSGYKTRSTSK